jgi:hypothetical protein
MLRINCYSIRNIHNTIANVYVSLCNLMSSSTFTSIAWKSPFFLIFKHHLTPLVLAAYKFCPPGHRGLSPPIITPGFRHRMNTWTPSSHIPFPNLLGPEFPERRHLIASSHLSRLLASTTSFSSIQHPLNHRFTLFYLSQKIKIWIYCRMVEENTAECVMCWYTEWLVIIYVVYRGKSYELQRLGGQKKFLAVLTL